MESRQIDSTHPVAGHLEPEEAVQRLAATGDYSLVLTDRRLAVAAGERLALNVPIEQLRRVQFDVERGRPASLALVPDRPSDEPQVLSVPLEHYEEVAAVVAEVGRRIYALR